jgi:hypothetical protein
MGMNPMVLVLLAAAGFAYYYYVYLPSLSGTSANTAATRTDTGTVITDPDKCTAAGNEKRTSTGKATGRPIQIGSWFWVPYGCSVQSGGDWATHLNSDNSGQSDPRKNDYTSLTS